MGSANPLDKGGGGDAPAAPDPVATANAQTASNRETAVAQAQLNNVNQYGPNGSSVYNVIGTENGVPRYENRVTLSPEQQRLYDQQNKLGSGLNNLAIDQTSRISGLLGTPLDLSDDTITKNMLNEYNSVYGDQWNSRQGQLDSKLANQGITQGSEAWNNAQRQFGQTRNDADNQFLLSGRQQAIQQALAQRNQPINEITALMSGGQVSMPQFSATPQTSIANTDIAGINQANFANQLGLYNTQQGTNNAAMGGLFGLGSSALGGWAQNGFSMSDRRAKENIEEVGVLWNGLPVFAFNYKSGGPRQIGLMAQDVEKVHPDAVREFDGMKHVNYAEAVQWPK